MILVNKNIICPQCGKIMGTKQVEPDRKAFFAEDAIVSDVICTDCRKKIEDDIKRKAAKR